MNPASGELPLEVSVDDVVYLLGLPTGRPRLIDCREPDEWAICHLAEAELIPLSQFAELAPQRFHDTTQHIVIYCHHGMRSQRAAAWLRQHGFGRVQSMRGGIDAWSEMVDPAVPRY
jgi:adenylyltransferase/sulfurtransferase